jgi:hypothetical protein
MSSNRGLSLVEAVVAVLIGALLVVAIGGLTERLIHHRVTADSNSAAMSLAERQMETLLAIPPLSANPPPGCTTAQDLCGGPPPNGLTHGPTSVNENLVASGSGPYSVQWVVIDANNTSPTTSPLALAASATSLVKKITVSVSHLRNPQVSATVVRYYKVS